MKMRFQISEQITVIRSQIWQGGLVEEIHSREQLAVQQVTCELAHFRELAKKSPK